jgi:hypothetical protein
VLIKRAVLDGIVAGKLDLAFRRWQRPTVKAGGRLRTAVGVLAVDEVEPVVWGRVTEAEARRSGHTNRAELGAALDGRDGTLYRIRLHYEGPDPRKALREQSSLTDEDIASLRARLERLDRASRTGPWTSLFLRIIAANPAVRAPDLAASIGWDKPPFKANVRKLKELGLTESLEVGYRLSPRGEALLSKTKARRRART